MKRIYLIAAALILFLIIGVNYYFKHNPARSAEQKVAQTTDLPGATAATPDNTQNAPVEDAGTAPTTCSPSVAANHHRHHRYHRRYARTNKTKIHTNNPGSTYAFADGQPENNVKHEVSKDYYAHKQNNEPQYSYTIVKEDNTIQPRHKIHFGIEAGLNQNSLTDNQTSNIQTLGFHAGGIVNFELGRNLAFQPGLMYIVMGNRQQSTLDVNTKEKLTLKYIELPANLVCKFGDPNNGRVMIGAGPYISYLVSAEDKFQTTTDGSTVDVLGNVPATPSYQPDNIRKFDWGIGGFIGCELPEGIYAKAGAQVGLRDIQHNADGSYSNRNYAFLVSIGYLFSYDK
jgi:hypothetical protein